MNQEKCEAGGVQDYQHQYLHRPSSSYKKLLDRVAFWIVYIAWTVGYKVVAYMSFLLEWGEEIDFFVYV